MLALQAVSRRYPNGPLALHDVTLTIAQGSFTALLGPSGCGKSTLLRIIAGLDQPDTGTRHWTAGAPPSPGQIGMVFQDPVLLPWATACANAALPLILRGTPRTQAHHKATHLLAELGLAGFDQARPRQLSGGMRMRVALARALSTAPDLLLMDEPFAALDEPTRHRLQDDLKALHRTRACTIVFVTHSIYEAAWLADHVVVLAARPGRVLHRLPMPTAEHASRLDPAYLAAIAAITAAMPAPAAA